MISIVLPVHNQADQLATLVDEYGKGLERVPQPHELLLVVNGCTDGSVAISQALAESRQDVRVLTSERAGWGLSVRLGLREARGEILCYTNSARTTGQDLVLLLLYALAYPQVVVKANRKIREGRRRRLGSLLYNLECRALFDLPNWDVNGTPKVFPRSFDKLLALTRDDDLIDAEFSLVCRREQYPMVEVPIFSSRRRGGRSTTGYRAAVRMYWGAYQLWQNTSRNGSR